MLCEKTYEVKVTGFRDLLTDDCKLMCVVYNHANDPVFAMSIRSVIEYMSYLGGDPSLSFTTVVKPFELTSGNGVKVSVFENYVLVPQAVKLI